MKKMSIDKMQKVNGGAVAATLPKPPNSKGSKTGGTGGSAGISASSIRHSLEEIGAAIGAFKTKSETFFY